MRTQKLLPIFIVMFSLCAFSLPAAAKKGGNGHGHGKPDSADHDDDGPDVSVSLHIGGQDRTVIQQYIAQDYHAHCPPGLAKKHNGCLPPGQAKKRYVVGQPIPAAVVWEPVPSQLLVQLQPVPAGYQYVRVDKDVLLIAEASHKVVDAITLLSAVGR